MWILECSTLLAYKSHANTSFLTDNLANNYTVVALWNFRGQRMCWCRALYGGIIPECIANPHWNLILFTRIPLPCPKSFSKRVKRKNTWDLHHDGQCASNNPTLNMMFGFTMINFWLTLLMSEWANNVIDDGWVRALAKTLPSLVRNLWWILSWVVEIWMKNHLVSDKNCNIVNP